MHTNQQPSTKRTFLGRTLILSSFLVVAVSAIWLGYFRLWPMEAKSQPVQVSQQTMGVGAIGRLEPGRKIIHVAPATSAESAIVGKLLVEEGQEVAVGTLIARLDTHPRRLAALEEAKAHVQIAKAKLELVQAGAKSEDIDSQTAVVNHQRANLKNAKTNYERAIVMVRNSSISVEEYEQRKMQLEVAQSQMRQAEANLASMKTVRKEDVAVAEAELAKAVAAVERAKVDVDTTEVRAPMNGRVLKVHARTGERVGENGIIELGDTTQMHAVAEVFERDVAKVKIGQRATVRLKSQPGELKGEVIHVGWKVGRRVVLDNDPVRDTDARVVEVRVQLDPPSSASVAGLSYARVEVNLDTTGGK